MAHDMADDRSAFDGRLLKDLTLVEHIEDDAALNRLQTVSCIGNRAVADDLFGVAVESTDQNIGNLRVYDVLLNLS